MRKYARFLRNREHCRKRENGTGRDWKAEGQIEMGSGKCMWGESETEGGVK